MSKWFSRWVSLSCLRQWLRDKIVETLYSNRATTENKRIHTPPPPLHSKLGCLLFSIGSSNSGTTLHGGDGGGKALFPLLEVSKASESPLGRSVSTTCNFVTNCSLQVLQWVRNTVNWPAHYFLRKITGHSIWPQTHVLKKSISHWLIKIDCMSDLNSTVSLTSFFSTMLQSCNIIIKQL